MRVIANSIGNSEPSARTALSSRRLPRTGPSAVARKWANPRRCCSRKFRRDDQVRHFFSNRVLAQVAKGVFRRRIPIDNQTGVVHGDNAIKSRLQELRACELRFLARAPSASFRCVMSSTLPSRKSSKPSSSQTERLFTESQIFSPSLRKASNSKAFKIPVSFSRRRSLSDLQGGHRVVLRRR